MHNDIFAAFDQLLRIVSELRKKCPWDQAQTIESLRHRTIEEVFELSEAILNKNTENIKEELGDVLLHIVLYAQIASETHQFSIKTIIQSLNKKLIHRHPHIYSNAIVNNIEEATQQWEQAKRKEKKYQGILEGIPASLPVFSKALCIQEKVASYGFPWKDKRILWDNLKQFMADLHNDATKGNHELMTEKLGDVLFCIISYAVCIQIKPEEALAKVNEKFIKKFEYIEKKMRNLGVALENITESTMQKYWKEAQ